VRGSLEDGVENKNKAKAKAKAKKEWATTDSFLLRCTVKIEPLREKGSQVPATSTIEQ
jgi:hypothetical protein